MRTALAALAGWRARPPPGGEDELAELVSGSAARLRRILEEATVPFWYPRAIDPTT